jgi:hypothetical protein
MKSCTLVPYHIILQYFTVYIICTLVHLHLLKFCLICYKNKENTKRISDEISDRAYLLIIFSTYFVEIIVIK